VFFAWVLVFHRSSFETLDLACPGGFFDNHEREKCRLATTSIKEGTGETEGKFHHKATTAFGLQVLRHGKWIGCNDCVLREAASLEIVGSEQRTFAP
jgi:hypothetical protein